uniref:type IX secretion/gliding motility protein PorT/SprT n=1 Tax=Roseivirga sp. TaxID=1964215 RepID=UPI0040485604
MQATHFWYKLYLHRPKIIFLLVLLLSKAAFAQKEPLVMHRIGTDDKLIKYGFFLGYHQNYYGIKYSDAFSTVDYDNVSSIVAQKNSGFNLGFMVNFRLDDQFIVRFVPVKIGLYQQLVSYNLTDGTVDEQLIESTRIEPGIYLKYRSIRRDNLRMYVIAGASASVRSGKAEELTTTDRLEIRKGDIKLEVGFGLENYFEFFKFAPEIRYSRGLMNVINPNDNFYSNGIDRITTHNFSIYLHFTD